MKQTAIATALFLLTAIAAGAQTGRKTSKQATTVDSINTPPRMDGNTGAYDTVRHPTKNAPRKAKGGTEYNYHIGTDSIGVRKK